VPETDDPRITFDREFLTAEQLSEWYAGLTAFISASKGEGWGLHHLQAMAVGRPIACATFSGVTEFFDSSVGYPLDYELKECDGFYDGKGLWGVPKKESIIETMQHIRKNKVEASHVGVRAAERAKLFTWEAAAKKLEAVLTEFDLL
jgi:glycosyltransferase involved in cell wall biosynthesis